MFLHPIFIFNADRGDREATGYIMKKIFALALLCLGFVALSCDEENVVVEETIASLKVVGGDTINVYVGDTAYINVEYSPSNAPAPRLYWYGYDQLLLRAYEGKNMIIARKRGATTLNIGMRDGDLSTSCVINISPVPFNLSYAEKAIYVADTFSIKPILPPEAAKNIRWKSSKPNVASVDVNGVVKGLSAGECEISAVAFINSDTVCSNKCYIAVSNVDMETLVMGDTLREVKYGKTVRFVVSHEPVNTTFTNIVWSSSDESVAIVDKNGNVTAVGIGSCVISATNEESGLVVKCNVVVPLYKMESLQLNEVNLRLEYGQKFVLAASYEPLDATFTDLEWNSSDESIAKVVNGEIEAVGVGDCVISVVSRENGMSAKCNVSVYITEMSSLKLSATKCEIPLGRSENLRAIFEPENATFAELYWSSSDKKVATVDNNGNVSSVGEGTCIITVSNKDNSLTAQCEVMVYASKIISISCPSHNAIEKGESFVLSATCLPLYISPGYELLHWSSSDNSIATVDVNTGKVNCVGVGECTITVVANSDNSVSASCLLTVLPISVKGISLNHSSMVLWAKETGKLLHTISPNNASNKAVKWESSDNSVATVSEDGVVTAVSEGQAAIKVTALDGSGCSAECVVIVKGEQYLKDYINNQISIVQTQTASVIGPGGSYYSYTFRVDNNGNETVYLKEVRGYGSTSGAITIGKQIGPGQSYEKTFNTESLDWVFDTNGIECIKRY